MKLLHQEGIISGFWATEINPLVPEIVDCGDTQHRYGSSVAPHVHGHWELYDQVAGKTRHHAIAAECGFARSQTLTRAIKLYTGLTQFG
jgi:hypothetical protein